MSSLKTVLITGANKGIGAEIAKKLLNTKKFRVILACRSEELGSKKAAELIAETGVPETNIMVVGNFDLNKIESIQNAAALIIKNSQDQKPLDVLINNAGMAYELDSTEAKSVIAKVTLGVNYFGTKAVTSVFLPLVKNGGRIINVSSRMGLIKDQVKNEELIDLFTNAPTKIGTVAKLDEIVNKYISLSDEAKSHVEAGFPESAYSFSKLVENALTRIQAASEPETLARGITIQSICPGFCHTEFTSYNKNAQRTPEDGAITAAWLASDESEELAKLNGEFFADDNLMGNAEKYKLRISYVDGSAIETA